jgi:cysteine synthase A
MRFNNILETIGKTPHIKLSRLFPGHEVWIKDERRNPGGSIKDRIALAMIEDAEQSGTLKRGSVIIEPTSGNTGIGLAMAGTVKGYRVILVMPESMSIERRKILKAYGADLVLTPAEKGMNGAVLKAQEIIKSTPGSWMPMQFDNPSNPRIHSKSTALEIISDFPEGFDYMVTGVGTGGHISGVGKELKKVFPLIKIYAVEPAGSAVLSGHSPGPHSIQGIGAGFVPKNFEEGIADKIVTIDESDAFRMVRSAALCEGLLAGISTGASLAAISQLVVDSQESRKVLTFAYDNGERYLSHRDLWDN